MGIDLTPEYVAIAETLIRVVDLTDRATFRVDSATGLPFDEASFDPATMVHVAMNVPDKGALCAEAGRVRKPGGVFAVYGVMRTGEGDLVYSGAWADTAATTFLAEPATYRQALEAAGFDVVTQADRRGPAVEFFRRIRARIAESGPPPLGPHLHMGPDASRKMANMIADLERQVVSPSRDDLPSLLTLQEPAMCAAAERRHMRSQRRGLLIALYGALIVGGLLLGRHLVDLTDFVVHPDNEAYLHRIIMTVVVIYVVVAALPFVPAAEIGLGLMLTLGAEIAVLVYACTVFALMLSYLVGRAIPPGGCAAVFGFFGFRRARDLVLEMAALDANARLELLLANAPPRLASNLVRHRYLALALALNLPGNSLLGGGGGIALTAGMSRLYPIPAYLASVAVAVAPVPLLIALSPLMQ